MLCYIIQVYYHFYSKFWKIIFFLEFEQSLDLKPRDSCFTTVLKLSLESDNLTRILLLDFSEAFDSINPTLMYNKLVSLLVFLYLAPKFKLAISVIDDRQCWLVALSHNFCLTFWCFTGSILGPLLFCLYISEKFDGRLW